MRFPSLVITHAGDWLLLSGLGAAILFLLQGRPYNGAFVDESDNFLGGFLILHGATLYRDYFSHHMPLPYYAAALASWLGAVSIEQYRTFVAVTLFAVYAFVALRFRRRVGPLVVATTIVSLAAAHTLFSGNMLLAETILSCALLVLFLYCYTYPSLEFPVGDQIVISVAVYATAMSSLISAYPLLGFALFYVFRQIRNHRPLRPILSFLAVVAAPFVATLAWLAFRGLMNDFVTEAITFNRVYYSRFDLASDPLSIINAAARGDYHYIRDNLTTASLTGGEGLLMLLAGVAGVVLAKQRGFAVGLLYWGLLVLSRLRPESFHDQAYFVLAIFGMALASSWAVVRVGRSATGARERLAAAALLGLTSLFYIALLRTDITASPDSSVGYAFPYTAAVDAMTEPGDKIWVGPIDPQAYLAAQREPASRYAFYLPWLAASPEISQGLIRDLETTQPPVIVMPLNAAIIRFSGSSRQIYSVRNYAESLADFLANDYVPVDANDPTWNAVFLRRDRAAELLQRLEKSGLYTPRTNS